MYVSQKWLAGDNLQGNEAQRLLFPLLSLFLRYCYFLRPATTQTEWQAPLYDIKKEQDELAKSYNYYNIYSLILYYSIYHI